MMMMMMMVVMMMMMMIMMIMMMTTMMMTVSVCTHRRVGNSSCPGGSAAMAVACDASASLFSLIFSANVLGLTEIQKGPE
jgi:hypothetical protein